MHSLPDKLKSHSLSVVVPAYNEEKIIETSIKALNTKLAAICDDYEIILVDDGSIDRTPEIAALLSSKLEFLKIIRNTQNQGIGTCLRKGFAAVSKELVLYIDADMPFDYDEISKAIIALDLAQADLVVGLRINRREESVLRYICSIVYNLLMKTVFHLKLADINCAFKLMKRDVLANLSLKLRGSCISVELLAKANYLGYKISQVKLYYYPRKDTKSRLFKLHIIFQDLFEIFKNYKEIKRVKECKSNKFSIPITSYSRLKFHIYQWIRKSTCPFPRMQECLEDKEGDIYDLGCGYGLFLNYLTRLIGRKNRYFGIDADKERIAFATALNRHDNVVFQVRDILTDLQLKDARYIILSDVLCLIPWLEQEKIISRCFNYLSDDGVLLIKEIDTAPKWKYFLTRMQEAFVFRFIRGVRNKNFYFRSSGDFKKILNLAGYRVEVSPIHKGYLHSHILFVCQKGKRL
ncbi:MAG: glycosyltransferase [Candidatus Omnitrophota bacterium]